MLRVHNKLWRYDGYASCCSIETKDTKAFLFYFECSLKLPDCLLRFHNLLIKTSRVCRTQTSSHKDFSNTREFSGKRVKLIVQSCKNRGNCHNSWIFRESSSQNCLLSQQKIFLKRIRCMEMKKCARGDA
jgi:hypothetical protein